MTRCTLPPRSGDVALLLCRLPKALAELQVLKGADKSIFQRSNVLQALGEPTPAVGHRRFGRGQSHDCPTSSHVLEDLRRRAEELGSSGEGHVWRGEDIHAAR